MTNREKLQARASGIGAWLADNAPYVSSDQKHLDADTPERAYWHYGYRAALLDVLRLTDGEEQKR